MQKAKAKARTMTGLVHPGPYGRAGQPGKTYSSIYRRVRKWRCNRTAKWRSLIIREHESFLWKKNLVSLFCFWIRDCRKSLAGALASVSDFRDTLKASQALTSQPSPPPNYDNIETNYCGRLRVSYYLSMPTFLRVKVHTYSIILPYIL